MTAYAFPCRAEDSLFDAPKPPDNPYADRRSNGACAHDSLVQVALCKIAWKRDYEAMFSGLVRGRSSGESNPVAESAGRYLRFLREKYRPHGWTVVDEQGRVVLCRQHDAEDWAATIRRLNEEER